MVAMRSAADDVWMIYKPADDMWMTYMKRGNLKPSAIKKSKSSVLI